MRGIVEGELYFEPLDRAPYAIDASLYEIDPLGVVVPRSEHDVVNVVRYAAENRIAVHVRGAGTDTGGGSLGRGLIVDLSRHLRQVISIGSEHVVVEAGVVLDVAQRAACAAGAAAGAGRRDNSRRDDGGGDDRGRRGGAAVDASTGRPATRSTGCAWSLRAARWPTSGSSPGRLIEAEPADFKDAGGSQAADDLPQQREPAGRGSVRAPSATAPATRLLARRRATRAFIWAGCWRARKGRWA